MPNNNKNIKRNGKINFYHAGCPVCVSAEHDIVNLIGATNVEIVHIGEDRNRIAEAEKAGVKSVPALLTPNGNVLHINFGASMADVKG
ncbi:MAG: thioredoxin family protein [Saprospiraceae bacterium]|nr:thioredoxin family protein [Saprospiraceae bacterium]